MRCSRPDGVTHDNYYIFNDGTKVPTPHPSAKLTPSPRGEGFMQHTIRLQILLRKIPVSCQWRYCYY